MVCECNKPPALPVCYHNWYKNRPDCNFFYKWSQICLAVNLIIFLMRISQKSRSFPTLEERCDQSCESAGLALSHQECEGFESNEIIGGALRQISQSEC